MLVEDKLPAHECGVEEPEAIEKNFGFLSLVLRRISFFVRSTTVQRPAESCHRWTHQQCQVIRQTLDLLHLHRRKHSSSVRAKKTISPFKQRTAIQRL